MRPVLQPPTLQKEQLQVSFLCIFRTTTLPYNFGAATLPWSYSCEKYDDPLLQKKTRKDFIKKLVQSKWGKKLGNFDIKSGNV